MEDHRIGVGEKAGTKTAFLANFPCPLVFCLSLPLSSYFLCRVCKLLRRNQVPNDGSVLYTVRRS